MAKKILLADDSITIQKVVELTFSDGDYEVTAVNNGAKAIQKLSEFRPDIILSDIIMPEKNGYEVCEFVKSHPDFRSIPVVLLTGTFEPFDPDRADKAGCDAVVTKPFESQSLIHKVEELIEQSRSAAPAAAAAPAPAPAEPETTSTPWDQPEAPAASSSFSPAPAGFTPAPAFTPAPEAPPPPSYAHDTDIFNAAPQAPSASEMPIEAPAESPFSSPDAAFAGETKAFPRMAFNELSNMTPTQEVPAPAVEPPAAPPWDEQPPLADRHQFAQAAFDEKPAEAEPAASASREEEADSPFGAPPPADEFRTDTRAFPRMNFDDLNAAASQAAQPTPPAAETPAQSPWDEPPAFSGETKAFPRMSFEDLQAAASQGNAGTEASAPSAPWGEPAPPPAPAWSQPEPTPAPEAAAPSDSFSAPSRFEEPPAAPFAPAAEAEPAAAPAWSSPGSASAAAPQTPSGASELSDEQIDRIARRVVQLMSDQVVRNIAWEVIPDLAEMVVKERIRQLEAEA